MPWSNSAAKKLAKERAEAAKTENAAKIAKKSTTKAGPFGKRKTPSPYGAAAKAARRKAEEEEATKETPKADNKKKIFGLFSDY